MSEFPNSLSHLMAELERVDLRLRLQVLRRRQRYGQTIDDEFRGLYISEEEIDDLLASESTTQSEQEGLFLSNSPIALRMRQLEGEIPERLSESLNSGRELRLNQLSDYFGLTEFERDTLLICLLPEIDTKYERLFAYLHDDVTRKRPTVDLVLQSLLDTLSERVTEREAFLPQAPLIAHHLLQIEEESTVKSPPLLARNIKIDDRIANYLLGSDQVDASLRHCARLVEPDIRFEDLVLPQDIRKQLSHLASRCQHGVGDVLYLQGPPGSGKRALSQALCKETGIPLLVIDTASLLSGEISVEKGIDLIFREACLQRSALCWNRFDLLISEDRTLTSYLNRIVEKTKGRGSPFFATGEISWHPGSSLGDKVFISLELSYPSHTDRKQLWERYLNGHHPKADSDPLLEVADIFRFTPGQIRDAATTAQNLAISHGYQEIPTSDLYAACRVTSNQKLSLLARKIQPRYEWDDIILPKDQKTQLREIANYVKYWQVVLADWNFENKISLGKGLNVLFAGPSGTGKTMASEIIAKELGLDLYKIDLSTVISKYIGETEKNLDRIFSEAQNSNALLFFDEADAVFGKRSEIRDSHDRYANIEVAYLLQKMEEYDGIVILATNLRKNLDEAFARRMHFSLEFPQPEEPDRYEIWKRVFPQQAPLAEDLDLKFMARQFKIAGGNIKNIALASAFLAADNGSTISIEHLIRATKREYQKIGRLCTEADFGPYFELVKG